MISRFFGLILLILLSPFFLIVSLIILFDDGRPILYTQKRPGKNNQIFNFYKFRTMRKETPEIATHLLQDPDSYLLHFGKLIRKLSLDELPNLINVIKGEMVFVGPRPALHNQDDLIALRTNLGIHKLMPGITGWAQINGRDELSIEDKVKLEEYYLNNRSFLLDMKIILLTVFNVLGMKGIAH